MKLAKFKAKNILQIFFASFVLISISFMFINSVSAYWAQFFTNKQSVDYALKSLEATSTDVEITGWQMSGYGGYAPYRISRYPFCDVYDENGECVEEALSLCPYIEMEPKDGEFQDIGYKLVDKNPSAVAEGSLSLSNDDVDYPEDLSDNWTFNVKAPCFEGECPSDYDPTVYGEPLPQSLKGKVFKCNVFVRPVDSPVPYIVKPKIAEASASNSNEIHISATLSGGGIMPGNSNVVFIPGIESSRLYTKGLLFENQLWEPNRNADVEKLFLDSNGESLDKNIYTRDIIKRSNVGMGILDSNVYKSFSDMMDGLVSEKKINAWEALPYDWRMDLNKIVTEPVKLENGTSYNFIDEIIRLAESSQTKKVSIVTHSNGGLVAKTLINELKKRGKENLIDQLVMVASPELGTPSAVTGLLHGDEQELVWGVLMNKSTARTLGENMMGAYNLLPSEEYFKKVASPVVEFDPSVDMYKNFRALYGDKIDSASKLRNFLLGTDGRAEPANTNTEIPNILKPALLSLAKTNHDLIDVWAPPEGVKVTELAGWGVSTVRGVKYIAREDCLANVTNCIKTVVLDRKPLFTEDGDQTVVSPSATVGANSYYLDLRKLKNTHSDIFEASSTLIFVNDTLLNSTTSLPQYVSKEKPISSDKKKELVLHSPVSIDVYDSFGRHTGLINNPNPNSDLQAYEEKIPGSRYVEFGEGKYVLLDEGIPYTVKLQGLDVGTFTFESNILSSGGDTLSSASFVDIPTSSDMKGEITISATSTGSTSISINVDVNGDGKNDVKINPSQDFDPIVYLQILKKTVETFSASQKTKNEINKKIDGIIKSLEKNKTKNAILKIKKFSKDLAIKTKHERDEIDRKHKGDRDIKNDRRKKKLNANDAEKLLQMINQLLNNLT